MPQVDLSLKEIYERACPKCKEMIIALVKDKLTDQTIRDTLEGKTIPKKED